MKKLFALTLLVVILAASSPAESAAPFKFEDYPALDDMRVYIENNFPLGSKRDDMRHAFVGEGKAVLVEHPRQKGVEKYIHDIDLCGHYVFRWNISADYDDGGKLLQAYVNGRFVFMSGKTPYEIPLYAVNSRSKTRVTARTRPDAPGGKQSNKYWLFDADGDPKTPDDELADGSGLQRADPGYISYTLDYEKVEPWRSIFDNDDAGPLTNFADCRNVLPHDADLEILLKPEVEKLQQQLDGLNKQLQQVPGAKP